MRHCIPADEITHWDPQKPGPCIYSDAPGGTNALGLSRFHEWKLLLTSWRGTALILPLIQTDTDLSYWNGNGKMH